MSATTNDRAVVLVSGGLDSTTVLAHALHAGFTCYALSVDYGQRHRAELDAARKLAVAAGVREHRVASVNLQDFGGSALTADEIAVPESPNPGIPVTYVPARNTVLLSLALAYAETVGATHVFIGANAVDYSGYPDCRPEYIAAFEILANLATKAAVEGQTMHVHAPLIDKTKAQIIRSGIQLGVDYAQTVSCYQADGQGRACGVCDACRIRKQGFSAAEIPDPTRYRQ